MPNTAILRAYGGATLTSGGVLDAWAPLHTFMTETTINADQHGVQRHLVAKDGGIERLYTHGQQSNDLDVWALRLIGDGVLELGLGWRNLDSNGAFTGPTYWMPSIKLPCQWMFALQTDDLVGSLTPAEFYEDDGSGAPKLWSAGVTEGDAKITLISARNMGTEDVVCESFYAGL